MEAMERREKKDESELLLKIVYLAPIPVLVMLCLAPSQVLVMLCLDPHQLLIC